MFVSSVSTVMFNANPLLRYDGYYILSDILEIPNLRQKASTILNRKLGEWCLGLEEPEDPFLPQRNQWLFATYTVASAIYRWVVTFSILYFLNKVFEPYGLKAPRPGDRPGLALWPVDSTAVEHVQVFQSAGEVRKSEEPSESMPRCPCSSVRSSASALCRCRRTCIARSKCKPGAPNCLCRASMAYWKRSSFSRATKSPKGQLLAQLHNIDVDIAIAELTGQRKVYSGPARRPASSEPG